MRGQDFVFNLKSEYPAREQVMQYGEDDLTFVSRLLSEVGIWFRFATDARLKIEVIEFYDDQSGYERGLTLPLRHPSGLFDGETEAVWGLNTAYSVVEKNVTTRDYNYRTATAEMMTEQHDATGAITPPTAKPTTMLTTSCKKAIKRQRKAARFMPVSATNAT